MRTAVAERETGAKAADETSAPDAVGRRILFISHANPEDNPVAAWFATQLTLLGYEVWCDLKNTHGGESDFWLKVQNVIENDAAKFIFLLSNASCDFAKKKGIYKEVQTASNLGIDNFVIPVRIEKLTRSLPILVNTGLYVSGENWAAGLRELTKRLRDDGVPRNGAVDFEKISSWWPALAIEEILFQGGEEELVSNVLPIHALPEEIRFLKIRSHGNPIAGFEQVGNALPAEPACYAHAEYAVTFAGTTDFAGLAADLILEEAYAENTHKFLCSGHSESGVTPDIAHNIVTYLISQAWDSYLAAKGLSAKTIGRSNRTIWYVRDGLITKNKASLAEPGKRKVPIHLVGTIKHYRTKYRWHFGVLPSVDLRLHHGILLCPKAVISLPDKTGCRLTGEVNPAALVDDKKVLKKLNWWNKEWRQKLLTMLCWLGEGQPEITIPVGSQRLVVSAATQCHLSDKPFREISDDDVINQAMGSIR